MSHAAEGSHESSAWLAAKEAVRSYSKDPSETNAEIVKQAWRRVRQVTRSAVERRMATELEEARRQYE